MPNADYFSAHETAVPVGWWLDALDLEKIAESVWAAAKTMRKAVAV